MRYTTAGESHGRALCAIVSGVPAGIPVEAASIDTDLSRRQSGYGRGGRQRIESDRVAILSGVRFGRTLGTPLCLTVANRDWDNWVDIMAVSGEKPQQIAETAPRPGHADLGGILKTRTHDTRDILERASARETAARVAAGGVAKALLLALGVEVHSYVHSIGNASLEASTDIYSLDWGAVEECDVRCPDAEIAQAMRDAVDAARAAGESLGGVFVVVVSGLVPGLGSYAEATRRLDADIAASVMSIPAIKGVEFGQAFLQATLPGSQVHDAIHFEQGHGYCRETNRAGGLEGGMTNGEPVVVRAAMKPIPTLMRPLDSVDILTHERVDASKERSDVCAVPAAAVVAEAEVAFALARAYLDTFGRDNLADIVERVNAYRERVAR